MATLDPLPNVDDGKLNKDQQALYDSWEAELKCFIAPCFTDPEFLENFLSTIPKEEQLNYVKNTSLYVFRNRYQQEVDPKYVLIFRRTIPSDKPKPEAFWTEEYGIARACLRNELPHGSPQRLYTAIFVATLETLNKHAATTYEQDELDKMYGCGSSDGEIRISNRPFDQNECLIAFKPKIEMQELEEYKKSPNYKTKEQVLRWIAEGKRVRQP